MSPQSSFIQNPETEKKTVKDTRDFSQANANTAATGDTLQPGQCYDSQTYYQILVIDRNIREKYSIKTKLVTEKRGDFQDEFQLDDKTIKALWNYPLRQQDSHNFVGSYLPSPGVYFPQGFMQTLATTHSASEEANSFDLHQFQTGLGTFYRPYRTLLQTRKLSQLISRTWSTYLTARESEKNPQQQYLTKFRTGNWQEIDSDILDGLISREIFLSAMEEPDEVGDLSSDWVYNPQYPYNHPKYPSEARYLILPTSPSWRGMRLALLLSGQAYRQVEGNKYHQINQPIFSTGEIVSIFQIEVDFNVFQGHIAEYIINQEKPVPYSKLVIPYPPIPSERNLTQDEIEQWANASLEDGNLAFYQHDGDRYLMQATHPHPPYAYLPVSMS